MFIFINKKFLKITSDSAEESSSFQTVLAKSPSVILGPFGAFSWFNACFKLGSLFNFIYFL